MAAFAVLLLVGRFLSTAGMGRELPTAKAPDRAKSAVCYNRFSGRGRSLLVKVQKLLVDRVTPK